MADDLLLLLAAASEEVPEIRPAFVESLRLELHRELGFAASAERVPTAEGSPVAPLPRARSRARPVLRARSLRERLWPVRPRVALALALITLLLVCVAAAAFVALRTWLSTAARGPQYASDYQLTEVLREPQALYSDIKAAPDGRSILAVRYPFPDDSRVIHPEESVIVRWDLATVPLTSTVVARLADFRAAALWDAGTNLQDRVVVGGSNSVGGEQLSVASNGDCFLSLAAPISPRPTSGPTPPTTLIVVHRDGTAQRVLTSRELADAGLLPADAPSGYVSGIASAPDRLWVRAELPVPNGSLFRFFEVVDPNADGDWSDRVVEPLRLPANVPAIADRDYTRAYGGLVAEPSTGAHDRSRSIVLPVWERDGRYRVFRVSDPDGDGDAGETGDAELLLDGIAGADGPDLPQLAARTVATDGGEVSLEELVATGLTLRTRISRLTPSGVVDIVRAVEWPAGGVVATPDGSIYVAMLDTTMGGGRQDFVLDRLRPAPSGYDISSQPIATAASPTPAPPALVPLGPLTPGVPVIAVNVLGQDGGSGEALGFGADGSGPVRLIDDEHVQGFCQSSGGTRVGYWSDAEAASEPFLYASAGDGSPPVKVSETAKSFLCGFPSDAMIISANSFTTAIRRDLASGVETTLADGISLPEGGASMSRDGLSVVVLRDAGRTMEVLDSATGSVRRTIRTADAVHSVWWSPDGQRLAFVVSAREYEVWIADVAQGDPRRLIAFGSDAPTLSWSSDSRLISALWHNTALNDEQRTGRLVAIDVASGTSRTIADDAIYGQWSPVEPSVLAWADMHALHIQTGDGPATTVSPGGTWPAAGVFEWMGWSPDGRYIGTAEGTSRLGVVDVAAQKFTVLAEEGNLLFAASKWWQP